MIDKNIPTRDQNIAFMNSRNTAVALFQAMPDTADPEAFITKWSKLFYEQWVDFRNKRDEASKKEICPDCKSELKLIPAGISKKSGKPYDEFYSCTGCKYTEGGKKQLELAKKSEAEDSLIQEMIQTNKSVRPN